MHIPYSAGFKIVSSWMNKYDLISGSIGSSNSAGQTKKKDNAKNQDMVTGKNEEKASADQNQETAEAACENQEKASTENQEKLTTAEIEEKKASKETKERASVENQEKAIDDDDDDNREATVHESPESEAIVDAAITDRRSGSNSSSSQDMEEDDQEGVDEDIPEEEALQDYSRSVESETATSKASTSSDASIYRKITALHLPGLFNMWKKPQTKLQALSPVKGASKGIPKISQKGAPKLKKGKPRRNKGTKGLTGSATLIDPDLCNLKPGWKNFSLAELQAATDSFSHEKLIGEGGYAEVYKGQLEDGKFVAIKRLTRGSPEEMTTDYLSELGIIIHVDHPNVAKIIGYGVEGGMHLVLELSPHGSLASLLYGPREKLNWDIRYKVAFGTAMGICYLHEGCQRRIIHKDIKAANILLTEDFQPQISDFGLSKWLPERWTHHTVSKIEGTFGYLPPEFFMHGIVDEKTDVFAYGVLILELITGRQALDSSQKSLVMWAKPLLKESCIEKLVDPTLGDAYNTEQLARLIMIGSACINQAAACRPQMSKVVKALNGDEAALANIIEENQKLKGGTNSEEYFDAEEFNSVNLIEQDKDDLSRHKEIVLGEETDISTEN